MFRPYLSESAGLVSALQWLPLVARWHTPVRAVMHASRAYALVAAAINSETCVWLGPCRTFADLLWLTTVAGEYNSTGNAYQKPDWHISCLSRSSFCLSPADISVAMRPNSSIANLNCQFSVDGIFSFLSFSSKIARFVSKTCVSGTPSWNWTHRVPPS